MCIRDRCAPGPAPAPAHGPEPDLKSFPQSTFGPSSVAKTSEPPQEQVEAVEEPGEPAPGPPLTSSQQMPEEQGPPVVLHPCADCGRRFNDKALVIHKKVCKKVFQQKRKVFDSSAARRPDTGPDDQGGKPRQRPRPGPKQKKGTCGQGKKSAAPTKPKEAKWRKDHEDFIGAMRACR
eukprot:TRINITY_DN17628_c0_g1_i1.p1 TRINITY_DN17628_c0_g1~~TRINITY_DN17628_c0_g1_i1.p1  ORF type:complete len:178 (+),score=27.74 TRINITY_DN17628_c0_g1_i1:151-684(+)